MDNFPVSHNKKREFRWLRLEACLSEAGDE